MHRSCLTYPDQHQCGHSILFSDFKKYKNLYICCFQKSICSIKRTLVVSVLALAWRGLENVFDRPWVFKCDTRTADSFVKFLYKYYNPYFVIFGFKLWVSNQNSSPSRLCLLCLFKTIILLIFPHWALVCSHSVVYSPCRLASALVSSSGGVGVFFLSYSWNLGSEFIR